MERSTRRSAIVPSTMVKSSLILRRLQPRWFSLKSSRKKAQISGEIQLRFSLSDSSNEAAPPEEIAAKWQAWQGNFVTTPNPSGDDQDPLSRDLGDDLPSEDDDEVGDTESIMAEKKAKKGKKKDKRIKKGGHYELYSGTDVVGVIFLEINSITDLPPERNSQLAQFPTKEINSDRYSDTYWV